MKNSCHEVRSGFGGSPPRQPSSVCSAPPPPGATTHKHTTPANMPVTYIETPAPMETTPAWQQAPVHDESGSLKNSYVALYRQTPDEDGGGVAPLPFGLTENAGGVGLRGCYKPWTGWCQVQPRCGLPAALPKDAVVIPYRAAAADPQSWYWEVDDLPPHDAAEIRQGTLVYQAVFRDDVCWTLLLVYTPEPEAHGTLLTLYRAHQAQHLRPAFNHWSAECAML